ncbi:MAG: universal stress protein [Myxococcota bacterium]
MSLALGTLLVPFDGSAPAYAAAKHARLLAEHTGATVILAYVLPDRALLADFGVGGEARTDATAMLEAEAKAFPGKTEIRLLEGDPPEAIAAEADRAGADVIVLGSRGRSPIVGIVLGSTTREVLQAATRPVLVAHEDVDAITTVLAGVERDVVALRVAEAAATVARACQARLVLVNVVDADPDLVAEPERFGIAAPVWKEALARHAERVFGPLRPLAPGAAEELRYGNAAGELRDAAEAHGAELLVVARKGSAGLDVDAWFSVASTLAVRGPFATLVV